MLSPSRRTHERFLEDFGDRALWEGHLKTINRPRYPHRDEPGDPRWGTAPSALHLIVDTVIRRGGSLAGLSVAEAAALAGVDPELVAVDVRELHWPTNAPTT